MRLKAVVSISVCLMFTLTLPNLGISQNENGQSHAAVLIPESTIEHPEDLGLRAHTNHLIRFEGRAAGGGAPSGETPASLRSLYNLPSSGGSGVIAIVDAYDYPTAENDLNVFSSQFGLPACTTANGCFSKVYASGSKPKANCGWRRRQRWTSNGPMRCHRMQDCSCRGGVKQFCEFVCGRERGNESGLG